MALVKDSLAVLAIVALLSRFAFRPRRVEIDFLIRRAEAQIERSKTLLPPAAVGVYREFRDRVKRPR